AMPYERVLQRGEVLVVRRQSLDGGDMRAVDERPRQETGAYELAVDEDAAGAADANATAFLRAGQAELVAQHVDQAQVRGDGQLAGSSVHLEADGVLGHRGATHSFSDADRAPPPA